MVCLWHVCAAFAPPQYHHIRNPTDDGINLKISFKEEAFFVGFSLTNEGKIGKAIFLSSLFYQELIMICVLHLEIRGRLTTLCTQNI